MVTLAQFSATSAFFAGNTLYILPHHRHGPLSQPSHLFIVTVDTLAAHLPSSPVSNS